MEYGYENDIMMITEDFRLAISEKIKELESLKKRVDKNIDRELKDLKSKVYFCPVCGESYLKNNWLVEEKVRQKKICSKFSSKIGECEFKNKDYKVLLGYCPKGHEIVIREELIF